MVPSLDLAAVHTPLGRRRFLQHASSRGTRLSERIVEVSNRRGSIGVLASEPHVAVGRHHVDPVPVRLQLVGENLGQSSAGALPHFNPVDVCMYGSILVDREVDRRGKSVMGRPRSERAHAFRHQRHSYDEAAGEAERLEHGAARNVGHGSALLFGHDQPSFAAR